MDVAEGVSALLGAGGGAEVDGVKYLPLLELASGARLGLDERGGWVLSGAHGTQRFAPGAERHFVELIEDPRRDFEARLEQAAAALGLPVDPLLAALPSVELVRAVLATRAGHLVRLALMWLLPSELRALRAEIATVAADERHPQTVRDLAARLVVPL